MKKPFKTILVSLGVTLAALAAGAGIFIYSMLEQINEPEAIEQIAPENESFDTESNNDYGSDMTQLDTAEIDWTEGEPPVDGTPGFDMPPADKKVINILLIGQDKRPGEKRARSDAIIIASYNKADKTLKLVSLMRDMYVPIPGYSDNRLNAAYSFGGIQLLDKTIEKDFRVPIDGTVEVNFEGFTKLVDLLKGLDVKLSKAEAGHLNKKFGWKLTEGQNHLNGQQALEYARIRHIGNGDFERTDRQRILLTNMYDSISRLNMTKKYQILSKILPYLTTDMSKQEILGYACAVLTGGIQSTESYRIPAEGGYKIAKIRDMAVLVPNLAKARALLKACIC